MIRANTSFLVVLLGTAACLQGEPPSEPCPEPSTQPPSIHEMVYRAHLRELGVYDAPPVEEVESGDAIDGYSRFRVAGAETLAKEHRALVSGEGAIPANLSVRTGLLLYANRDPDDVEPLARAIGWLFGWELVLPGSDAARAGEWADWVHAPVVTSAAIREDIFGSDPLDIFFAAVYRDGDAMPHLFNVTAGEESWRTSKSSIDLMQECEIEPGHLLVMPCHGVAPPAGEHQASR